MNKGGKVVHISDGLHERLRRFCQSHDMTMKEWVEKTLTIALDSPRIPVEKKCMAHYDDHVEEELWSRPPFWKQKPRRDESVA